MSEAKRQDPIQGEIIHVYDEIEEADNDLPRWWVWIMYGSIAFAAAYWFYYHEYGIGDLPRDAYAAAMEARAGEEVTPELLATLAQDEEAVESGRALFATNCVACHAAEGQGQIGPNLTDGFWIHGGAPMDVYGVVADGVLDKGMPPWAGPLGPKGTRDVVAFVLSIRDTNVPGKEPQGEAYVP